jgi:hypothetical protein
MSKTRLNRGIPKMMAEIRQTTRTVAREISRDKPEDVMAEKIAPAPFLLRVVEKVKTFFRRLFNRRPRANPVQKALPFVKPRVKGKAVPKLWSKMERARARGVLPVAHGKKRRALLRAIARSA